MSERNMILKWKKYSWQTGRNTVRTLREIQLTHQRKYSFLDSRSVAEVGANRALCRLDGIGLDWGLRCISGFQGSDEGLLNKILWGWWWWWWWWWWQWWCRWWFRRQENLWFNWFMLDLLPIAYCQAGLESNKSINQINGDNDCGVDDDSCWYWW